MNIFNFISDPHREDVELKAHIERLKELGKRHDERLRQEIRLEGEKIRASAEILNQIIK